jgi:hypothetical protein
MSSSAIYQLIENLKPSQKIQSVIQVVGIICSVVESASKQQAMTSAQKAKLAIEIAQSVWLKLKAIQPPIISSDLLDEAKIVLQDPVQLSRIVDGVVWIAKMASSIQSVSNGCLCS